MDNYEIKNKIKELIKIIYSQYNCVGGALHIVLDDNNIESYNIIWCIKNSINEIKDEKEKGIYMECAKLLLKLSYSSRKRLLKDIKL